MLCACCTCVSKLQHVRVLGMSGMRGTPEERPIVSIDTWRPQWVAVGCHACLTYPKHAHATISIHPYNTHTAQKKTQIHFLISNLDARKKLNIWAYAQFQGASVCCPQILLNIKIFTWKIRYPVMFHHMPAISTLFERVRLVSVLKNQPLRLSETQDLRVFDLDT